MDDFIDDRAVPEEEDMEDDNSIDDIRRYSFDLEKDGPVFDYFDYEDDPTEKKDIFNYSQSESEMMDIVDDDNEDANIEEDENNPEIDIKNVPQYPNARSYLEKVIRSLEKRVANEALMKDSQDEEWYQMDNRLIDDSELDKLKGTTSKNMLDSALDIKKFMIKKASVHEEPASMEEKEQKETLVSNEKESNKQRKKGEFTILTEEEKQLAASWIPPKDGECYLLELQDAVNQLINESYKFNVWSSTFDKPLCLLDYYVRKETITRPSSYHCKLLTVLPYTNRIDTIRLQLRRLQRSHSVIVLFYKVIHVYIDAYKQITSLIHSETVSITEKDILKTLANIFTVYQQFYESILNYNKVASSTQIINVSDEAKIKKHFVSSILSLCKQKNKQITDKSHLIPVRSLPFYEKEMKKVLSSVPAFNETTDVERSPLYEPVFLSYVKTSYESLTQINTLQTMVNEINAKLSEKESAPIPVPSKNNETTMEEENEGIPGTAPQGLVFDLPARFNSQDFQVIDHN